MINRIPNQGKVDLWAIGIILFQISTGELPFDLSKGSDQNINNVNMDGLPADLTDLIQKLLRINPNNRIDWVQYFQHPFITNDLPHHEEEEGKLNLLNITAEKPYLNQTFFHYRIFGKSSVIHQYLHNKRKWVGYKIKLEIPLDPTFVPYLGKIFLLGGALLALSFIPVDTCLMVDLNEVKVKNRAKKIAAYPIKSVGHGAVGIKNFIVCCGGEINEGGTFILNCFKYSIENDTWVQMSDLHKPICEQTLIAVNNAIIYSFGGRFEDRSNNGRIEKLDFPKNEEKGWEILEISSSLWSPRDGVGATQINDEEIILMGGRTPDDKTNQVLIFNFNTLEMRESFPLSNKCGFYSNSKPILIGNCIYGVDSFENLVIYDLEEKNSTHKPIDLWKIKNYA